MRQDNLESLEPVVELSQPDTGLFAELAAHHLTWFPVLGLGFYPVIAGLSPYGKAYFEEYARRAQTELGRALMRARVAFVARHYDGPLVDIGIGSGAFIEARGAATFGFDVNPLGRAWLEERRLWCNPYEGATPAASLWDVLEHIHDFRPLLACVRDWLFVTVPIVPDPEIGPGPSWKHYKPLEHCWYFSEHGLVWMLRRCGFHLIEKHREESELGREDIGSFAFRRRPVR